ncbi:MAG: hypothetical protein IPM99_12710 [Rubrivivax sp.]|nr:hypothetical protein [Rubrivivax sp.]
MHVSWGGKASDVLARDKARRARGSRRARLLKPLTAFRSVLPAPLAHSIATMSVAMGTSIDAPWMARAARCVMTSDALSDGMLR